MGRTSYHAAVEDVVAHYEKSEHRHPRPGRLPDGRRPRTRRPPPPRPSRTRPKHPLFFSFVAFGEPRTKAFDYLRKLKPDNTSFFHAGPTPRELTDTELYEGLLAAWRP